MLEIWHKNYWRGKTFLIHFCIFLFMVYFLWVRLSIPKFLNTLKEPFSNTGLIYMKKKICQRRVTLTWLCKTLSIKKKLCCIVFDLTPNYSSHWRCQCQGCKDEIVNWTLCRFWNMCLLLASLSTMDMR